MKKLLQVAAISLAVSATALDAQAQTRAPDLIKDLTEMCAKLEEARAGLREIEYEISIAELYVELYTNKREELIREGLDRVELDGRYIITAEFQDVVSRKASWGWRLAKAEFRHPLAASSEERAVSAKEAAQKRLADAVGRTPLLDSSLRDVVIDDGTADKIKKDLDKLGELLKDFGDGESQPPKPGDPGAYSPVVAAMSHDEFVAFVNELDPTTFDPVPFESCTDVTTVDPHRYRPNYTHPFLLPGGSYDPMLYLDYFGLGQCFVDFLADPATPSVAIGGPFVLDTEEAKRLAEEMAERAKKLREAEERARMEREKAQRAQTLFAEEPAPEMVYDDSVFIAQVTGFGAWDTMPPARLGSRDLNTLSPEGNDLSDRDEMERLGGRVFLGVAPWLSDPWVYPTGWRGGVSLELTRGDGDGGRTFNTPPGTMPTIVALTGVNAYALNNQTTFDRDIDSTDANFHAKIGNTFGLPEGIGLTPYVALEGAWSQTEADTTIRTSGPGVFNGFLNEDITALRLGVLLGLEAAIPIFDGLFLTLGAAGGVVEHWLRYEGNDCGSNDATGGPCNGGFFQTNVKQNKTFTGFAGEGSAGLEWFIPCGGGRHCASLLFRGTAGRFSAPEADYPSNVGRVISLRSTNETSYGINAGITVPLGGVP